MGDGTRRGKIRDLNKVFQVATKLKGLRIYNDVGKSSEYNWFNNISINEDEDTNSE